MDFKIELQNISFAYEGVPPLFDDVNLTLRQGEITGIVSAVGEGKSTLLKICAGLIRPTQGELMIDGKLFWNLEDRERNEIRRRMGFDFQEGALIANMTVFQNLMLPITYHGTLAQRKAAGVIDEWLRRMDIYEYRNVLPAALSSGLRRRVSYIRLMMTEGIYFFWDEPVEEAASQHAALVADTILEKKGQGFGSLLSTQNAGFLAKVADRAIVVGDGKVRYDGPLAGGRIPVEFDMGGMIRG